MVDVTLKSLDELDGYEGRFLYAGKGLGVTAWGMNVLRLPPAFADYPEHDHAEDGNEEVYVVLEGSATLQLGDEARELAPGTLARVGPGAKRKVIPGADGATILVIGGTPGKAYEPKS